jgi:NAD(P)-dependent dehydrogenase (short-subunit alcohol dehydrogenase family)
VLLSKRAIKSEVNIMKFSPSAVVTGVSAGIVYETAVMLAEKGFHVFGSVRKTADVDRLRTESGDRLTPLLLSLRDTQAIKASADLVGSRLYGQRLTTLVNHAARISNPVH